MALSILILVILILVNAFLALAEMALVSVSRPMLKQLSKQGDWQAIKALELAENPGRFLSTVQVCLTLVGVASGAYGGATFSEPLTQWFTQFPLIAEYAEGIAVGIVVTSITIATVLFAELVPKQIALTNPVLFARFVAAPMLVLTAFLNPIASLLHKSGHGLLHILGLSRKDADSITEDEVKAVIAEGAESGAIDPTEHEILQRIIRLGDRDVKSIMTHRMEVIFIDVKDPYEEIKRVVNETGHARYPVTDGDIDDVIGVVHSKELLDAVLQGRELKLRDYVREMPSLPENTACFKALEIFKSTRAHMATVLDEYGAIQGVVTDADILEAIIGAMPSNYDVEEGPQIVQREDGSWLVDGLTTIHEIHLNIGLEQIKTTEKFDTIAGFLLHEFGRPPTAGEHVEAHGYRFEIMDMDGRRIDKVLVQLLSPSEPAAEQ
jgi:putative hemolysin